MINLLPTAVKTDRAYGRRNVIMLSTIILLFSACLIVISVFLVSQRFIGKDDEQIRTQITENNKSVLELEKQIKDISAVAKRLETTSKVYDSSINFSKLIPQIGGLLPRGTIINGLSLTGGTTDPLTLSVSMTSADLAPVLQSNLVQSDLFEAADINSIASLTSTDGNPYTYTAAVSISFTGSAEAKAKAAAKVKADAEAKKAAEAAAI